MRRVVTCSGLFVAALSLVHCTGSPRGEETIASQRSALCAAEWEPSWQQGSGANEWWVEYTIGGGDVASASLEVVGAGSVTLAKQYGKWVGKTAKIPRGTSVVVHASTSAGLDAQTQPFGYLAVTSPTTDHCTSGDTCGDAFRPSFTQGGGANAWWVEYAISGNVTSAYLELPSGAAVALASGAGKWRGAPKAAIPAGTMVTLHASSTSGDARSEPFPYLTQTKPALAPCAPSGGTCSATFTPTWAQGGGANEWWVEYRISGAVGSARLEVPGGITVVLGYADGKWRGSPSARIPRGTTVVLHADSTAHASATSKPFAYLVDEAPATAPCDTPPSPATSTDVGGTDTGPDVFGTGEILYDATNDKLLLLGALNFGRPAMHRCNPDGTACTAAILDAGYGTGAGTASAAVIDTTAQKLLFASFTGPSASISGSASTSTETLSVFGCELDGSGCVRHEVSGANAGASGSGSGASVVIDRASSKLVIASCSFTDNADVVELSRCELDGTGCAVTRLRSNDAGLICRSAPSLVLDEAASALSVFMLDESQGRRLAQTRCNLQASACATSFLPAPERFEEVKAVLDPSSRRLTVTTDEPGENGDAIALVNCAADGTGCTVRPLTAHGYATPKIVGGELVLSVSDPNDQSGPILFRCDPAGAACTKTSLPLNRFWAGGTPPPAPLGYDPTRDTFLVATSTTVDDGAGPYELAPFVLRAPRSGGAADLHDVSAGIGENRFVGQSGVGDGAFIDDANRRLLVLGETKNLGLQASRRIRRPLSRCNLDGSACSVVETGTGQDILGITGGHLYMLGVDRGDPRLDPNPSVIEVLRCNVDGTSCTRTDVERPIADATGALPLATLDVAHGYVVVATQAPNVASFRLYRCPLDGSACVAPVALPPLLPQAMAAVPNALLLASGEGGHVLRCQPDGTGCTDVVVDPVASDSRVLRILSDANGLIFLYETAPAEGAQHGGLAVVTCKLDATACTRRELALGAGAQVLTASGTLDRSGHLLVATDDEVHQRRASAYQCDRDGAACTFLDLSAGQPAGSGANPTVLFDAVNQRVDVVTVDETRLWRPSLFSAAVRP